MLAGKMLVSLPKLTGLLICIPMYLGFIYDIYAFLLMQALHEALMRQEELLAYIDRQEEAKSQVNFKKIK